MKLQLQRRRRQGLTLLEVTFAVSVFLILAGVVAVSLSVSGLAGGEAYRANIALRTLRAMVAHVQEVANDPAATSGIAAVFPTFHFNPDETTEAYDATDSNNDGIRNQADEDGDNIPDRFFSLSDIFGWDDVRFNNTANPTYPDRVPSLQGTGPGNQAFAYVEAFRNETSSQSGSTNGVFRHRRIPDELGGPRDLNLDGDASDMLIPTDCRVVPMIITVRWTEKGQGGQITRSLTTYHIAARTATND